MPWPAAFDLTGAEFRTQVVVLRSSGAKTLAEVESVSPGWVKVKLDEVGSWKSVPEEEIYRLVQSPADSPAAKTVTV